MDVAVATRVADVKRCFRNEHTWGTVFGKLTTRLAIMFRGRQLDNDERILALGFEPGEAVTIVCSQAVYEASGTGDWKGRGYVPILGDAMVDGLLRVVFDARFTTVEYGAIELCPYLIEMQLPREVRVIDNNAFCGCEALQRVNLEDCSLEEIYTDAFRGCRSLSILRFPETLQAIHGGAFAGCYNLRDVRLPSRLREIGPQAFYGCSRLPSVTLPVRVHVGREALCTSWHGPPLRVLAWANCTDAVEGCDMRPLECTCGSCQYEWIEDGWICPGEASGM